MQQQLRDNVLGVRTYNLNCQEVKKRIQTKSDNDAKQSNKHWTEYQSNKKKMAEQR